MNTNRTVQEQWKKVDPTNKMSLILTEVGKSNFGKIKTQPTNVGRIALKQPPSGWLRQ